MTAIYCVKCRGITNTKQEKRETTVNGRNRLSGICVTCNTKKGTFVNSKWKFHEKTHEEKEKTPEEQEVAERKKVERSLKKKAFKIGWKLLANDEAKDCVKNCLAKTRK